MAALEERRAALRRLEMQADGDVVCAGAVADVFGDADRVVLCLEREGSPVEELLVLRLRDRLYAVVNRCPHLGRELDDGRVHGHVLTCLGHGRSYSLRTGRRAGPLPRGGPPVLRSVRAWEEDGKVFLDLTGL
ncbi:MAG TPA: Rieske 2Fe-2S domain-containing protein [Trebonia sp.]|jgi:nitrite reductase/ring-hydroxylating ferredoxin subunit|nr:Rieske 2Fe-2S domain-containing protein [Trebonia sp.]